MRVTYVDGPTALLEWRGQRLLTDPTFDPAGTEYEQPGYTLRKTQSPAVEVERLGRIDAVLLSHDHHLDNLDQAGPRLLPRTGLVITTHDGAARLRDRAAVLNLGAARIAAAGPKPLTFTAAEAVEVARAMPNATIVPLHFEGWAHFTESRAEIDDAFARARLSNRLSWPRPGEPIEVC